MDGKKTMTPGATKPPMSYGSKANVKESKAKTFSKRFKKS